MQYFYSHDGAKQQGPVSLDQLRALPLSPTTMVWYDGLPEWTPARNLPELADLFQGAGAVIAQPGAAGQPGYVAYETPTPQSATNGLALTSMILGIVGIVLVPCISVLAVVPAILAIVFGHVSRGQIRRGKGIGKGFALAGLILGYITLVLMVTLVGLFIAFTTTSVQTTSTPTTTFTFTPPPNVPIPQFPTTRKY